MAWFERAADVFFRLATVPCRRQWHWWRPVPPREYDPDINLRRGQLPVTYTPEAGGPMRLRFVPLALHRCRLCGEESVVVGDGRSPLRFPLSSYQCAESRRRIILRLDVQ